MSRLNDTKGITGIPLKGGSRVDPNAGRAVTARLAIPGTLQFSYGGDSLDLVATPKAEPGVGRESGGFARAFECSARTPRRT